MNKFLIVFALLGLILISGCINEDSFNYEITLDNGTKLNCDDYQVTECGLSLYRCNNNITYRCVTNVKVRAVKE